MSKRFVRAEGFPQIKRQTARNYTHVVIAEYNTAAARSESAIASATKYAQSSWRDWAKGDDQYKRRVLQRLADAGIRTEEAYVKSELASREKGIAEREAQGTIALAWAGSLALAQKQLPSINRYNSWANVRIVAVVE